MFSEFIRKDIVKAGAIFLLVLLVLFSAIFLKGYIFGGGDTTAAAGMTGQLSIYHSETGEYPLWQPYIFSGMPSFSSMMYTKGVYFPNYLIGILGQLGLPPLWGMLFHYLFAAMGAYILLRHLKTDHFSAILGGLAYMLTPFFIVMITAGHGSQMMTAAYLPWLIYATKRIFDQPDLKGLIILAIVAGFQLQRGHVQVAYYGWMAIGWYVVIEVIFRALGKNWKNFHLSVGYLLGGLMLGIGLAAVLYIPSLAYVAHTIRGGSAGGGLEYGYATSWSFPPYEFIALFFSDWFGFGGQTYWGGRTFTEHSDFIGLTLLILMVAAFFNRENLKEKVFLLSTILLALLVSFGSYWPYLYDMLFKLLPFFNKFRVPSMILILMELMAAILAGVGLFTLVTMDEKRRAELVKKMLIATSVMGGLFVIVLLFKGMITGAFSNALVDSPKHHPQLSSARIDMFYASLIKGLFIGTLGLAVIWAYFAQKIKGMVLSLAMIALVVVELGHVDLRFTKNAVAKRRGLAGEQETPAIRKLKQLTAENPGRVFPVHTLFGSNVWALHGLESIGGYSPAKLKILQDFLNSTRIEQTFLPKYYAQTASGTTPKLIGDVDPALRKRHLDLLRNLNVKYLVSPYPMNDPLFKLIDQPVHIVRGQRAQVLIYEFTDDYSRAWFVPEIVTVSTSSDMSLKMDASLSSPADIAYVLDPEGSLGKSTYGVGTVNVEEHSLQSLQLKTDNNEDGFLIVSEVYYAAGWSIYMEDDTKLEMFASNELIRGIPVPAGQHTLKFVYEPPAVRAGFRITLLSALIILGLGAFLFYRSRQHTEQE
ncbi:MAG: hypothetical protein HOD11_14395 [Candidatus Marinimicrobia bacterium]|nr:hypothetical protein [Candidatus Neomarinimicrobiota bacterium]